MHKFNLVRGAYSLHICCMDGWAQTNRFRFSSKTYFIANIFGRCDLTCSKTENLTINISVSIHDCTHSCAVCAVLQYCRTLAATAVAAPALGRHDLMQPGFGEFHCVWINERNDGTRNFFFDSESTCCCSSSLISKCLVEWNERNAILIAIKTTLMWELNET